MEMLEDEGVDGIRVIDVQEKSNEMDYLILGTVESNRHRRAVANYIYLQVGSLFLPFFIPFFAKF